MSDSQSESKPDSGGIGPRIKPISQPMDVPVFNCILYVSRQDDGQVRARAANLADFQFTSNSEPDALRQAITEIKQQLSQWHAAGEPIPWLDPPLDSESGEETRYLPVHL